MRFLFHIVRFVGIVLLFAALPFYGLWIGAGALADRWERRQRLKGTETR